MTHHQKENTTPPIEISKKRKFTADVAMAIYVATALIAATLWFGNTNSNAASLDSRVTKLESIQEKMSEDVTITRTKVEMILKHFENQDTHK